jgi:hypothetical protein
MTEAPGVTGPGERPRAPAVGLPGRIDVRRAFDVYVWGRSRTLGPDEKAESVGGAHGTRPAVPREGTSALPSSGTRKRIAVPDELRFERSAGVWRLRGSEGPAGSRAD